MGAKSQPVLDAGELNDTDVEILDLLHTGRVTPPYAAAELDKSREYASERLIRLKEHKHVRRIAPGLYELVDDPRDDADAVEDDTDAIRDAVRDAREAYEDVDGDGVGDAIARLEELTEVDDAVDD